jgi:hypothetical protein
MHATLAHRKAPASVWWRMVAEGWRFGYHLFYTISPEASHDLAMAASVPGLDDIHWMYLWSALGSTSDQALAADKLALATRICALGARVPPTLQEISVGSKPRLDPWPWGKGRVIVKPRHGSRARGIVSITPLAGIDAVSVSMGGERHTLRMPIDELERRLALLAERDSLLVQPFLPTARQLADLSSAPVELRLTAVRLPDAPARVVSCVAKVQPPGAQVSTTMSGAMAVPVDPNRGIMSAAILFRRPGERFDHAPWNGAPVRGRTVPFFEETVGMVEAASQALPGLPAIGWDVLLTDDGPVVLEANTGLAWSFMHLWHAEARLPSPVLPVVRAWLDRMATIPSDPPA